MGSQALRLKEFITYRVANGQPRYIGLKGMSIRKMVFFLEIDILFMNSVTSNPLFTFRWGSANAVLFFGA